MKYIYAAISIGLFLFSFGAVAEQTPPATPMEAAISTSMPYPSKFVDVLGSKMHYVDSGSGEVFLFLHGNPSSSYLWRNVMPHIAPLGRVIAVDLIGFGQSEKPKLDYTFQTHRKYVNGFIAALGLKNITLVIHDWGSMLGLDYARRNEKNVKAIAMMEAIIPPTFPMSGYEALGPIGNTFKNFRTPELGRKLLVDQNIFIEGILLNGAITRKLSEIEKNVYREPFLDPGSREPIYVWPNELPIGGVPERNVIAVEKVGKWLKKSRVPKLLLYASPGALVNADKAQWMQDNYRNLEAVFVGYGAHYIQEDNPEAIGRNIFHWYKRKFPE